MRIGILGYGTVGSGVYELLQETNKTKNQEIEVVRVWNRPNPTKNIPLYCEEVDTIIQDTTIQCVVETLNGIHPAYELIKACLLQGKHVVTANKAVVAAYFEEFQQLAEENGVQCRYEASVGGGIPWITSLEQVKQSEDIRCIRGIFNGTSNYILSNMTESGMDFREALQDAQKLGYAEADPSADVDGMDSINKLVISAQVGFNRSIQMRDLVEHSMRHVTAKDISYFKKLGYVLKYVGEIVRDEGTWEGSVMLQAVPNTHLLANVSQNNNMGLLTGSISGEMAFYGQGAGKYPTAQAMIRDIEKIREKSEENKVTYSSLVWNDHREHRFILISEEAVESDWFVHQEGAYYDSLPMTFDTLEAVIKKLSSSVRVIKYFGEGE